jgi:hypothetical protein
VWKAGALELSLSLTDKNQRGNLTGVSIVHQHKSFLEFRKTVSVVQWSQFLATDPEARVRFPALSEKKVVGLERGPLSLVSTTEELLHRKVAAPV